MITPLTRVAFVVYGCSVCDSCAVRSEHGQSTKGSVSGNWDVGLMIGSSRFSLLILHAC